ncbi:MAG TPA: hypothetical protein VEA63_10525 [Opitutus sp.]|nr:hypothetical protein [Opitutus sp.]
MRFSRLGSVLFCLAIIGSSLARAADIEFVRVWPGWRDAADFESISEYFSGRENTGRRVVLRSQADARAGFYYLVRVMNSAAPQTGAKFSLQVIAPASPDVKTYAFPADIPARATVFQLGLTGADWPNKETHPVAWKLDLLDAKGQVLASQQSFLWAMPAK